MPLDLSAGILRRLARWGLAYVAFAVAVFAWAARDDVRAETDDVALVALLDGVERLRAGDGSALPGLIALGSRGGPRHLGFSLEREGATLVASADDARASANAHTVGWSDAEGARWAVRLWPDPAAETAEVVRSAALLGGLMLAAAGVLVAGVIASVRAETAPLAAMSGAIGAYARGDFAARSPRLRAREFDALGAALNALADALVDARAQASGLSRRLVAAEDDLRRWIARELHDELGQWLTAARVDAAFLRGRLDGAAAEAAQALEHALAQTTARVRVLLERLRPHGLDAEPSPPGALVLALQELVAGWRSRSGPDAAAPQIELDILLGDRAFPNAVAVAVYRVAQESLTNAMRHGRAQRVRVRVCRVAQALDVQVDDDGGAGPDPVPSDSLGGGRGLAGLSERVGLLGGMLEAGPATGGSGGWRVRASIPVSGGPEPAANGAAGASGSETWAC